MAISEGCFVVAGNDPAVVAKLREVMPLACAHHNGAPSPNNAPSAKPAPGM
jgi:hypothetical protein